MNVKVLIETFFLEMSYFFETILYQILHMELIYRFVTYNFQFIEF